MTRFPLKDCEVGYTRKMLTSATRCLITFLVGLAVLTGLARAQDLSQPGPWEAGERSVTVTRPDNTTFTAQLFYPATLPGANTPFQPAGAPYPGLTFGHGFLTPVSNYNSTLRHLATWGHFVIATTTQGSLFPSHAAFALDMRHCLTWLEQQNVDAQSPYFGGIDTLALGAFGHSMGGGATILAAAADPRIIAIAPMAPANTNPSSITAMASVTVPSRLICGTQDTIVPTSSNGQLMYNAAPGPRQLLSILNGWHCGFVDTPPAGGLGCDSGALPLDQQLSIVRRHLTSFFRLHLAGDQSQWGQVWGVPLLLDGTTSIQRDPRATITPAVVRKNGFAGDTLDFPLTLTNTGSTPTSFTLFTEQNTWAASLSTSQTAVLAPGASEVVHLYVVVPANTPNSVDRCTVSARRDIDNAVRTFARTGSKRL